MKTAFLCGLFIRDILEKCHMCCWCKYHNLLFIDMCSCLEYCNCKTHFHSSLIFWLKIVPLIAIRVKYTSGKFALVDTVCRLDTHNIGWGNFIGYGSMDVWV